MREPGNAIVPGGRMRQRRGESEAEFSQRVARYRARCLDERRQAIYERTERQDPIACMLRAIGGGNTGTVRITGS